MSPAQTTWELLGSDGKSFESNVPGAMGGHRRSRIYGRLDCRSALSAIARGGYVSHRVFFLDEQAARAAGYRPCSRCLSAEYAQWKFGAEPDFSTRRKIESRRG